MSSHKNLRGRDLHAPTNELVENGTGSTLTQLKVVRLNQMGTVYPRVILADPNNRINFGVVQDDIKPGKAGYVCCFGFMFEIDTSPWTVGTVLYSDDSGNLTDQVNGGIVAYVIRQDAEFGVLYVVTEPANTVNSTSWRLNGNNGIDELISFLGTTDAADLRIRTNNVLRAVFSKDGRLGLGPDLTNPESHFHQKSHTGYTGSGLRQETYSVKTTSTTPQVAKSIPMAQNTMLKVEFTAIGRLADGTGRAVFKRTGVFFREGSNIQILRFWQTDVTEKTSPDFNVTYTLGVNELVLNVKSASGQETYWTGSVKIEAVGTDL